MLFLKLKIVCIRDIYNTQLLMLPAFPKTKIWCFERIKAEPTVNKKLLGCSLPIFIIHIDHTDTPQSRHLSSSLSLQPKHKIAKDSQPVCRSVLISYDLRTTKHTKKADTPPQRTTPIFSTRLRNSAPSVTSVSWSRVSSRACSRRCRSWSRLDGWRFRLRRRLRLLCLLASWL